MAEKYRLSFCAWNKNLDYQMSECGDEWGDFNTDEEAILAAETSLEGKLNRGIRKAHCIIEVMKDKYTSKRWVKTLQRPESEFRRTPSRAPDPNQTILYTGLPQQPKK